MHTKQLGNTDMHITRIGFGAWAIGGGRSAEQVDGICRAEEIIDFPIDF